MGNTMRRLLIATLLSATGFAATQIWYIYTEPEKKSNTTAKPIARLVSSVNDVQKKSLEKIIWQPAIHGETLHAGESIRTYSKSEARIEFLNSSAVIDLEPDSAIVLEENNGSIALDFLQGNIFVKTEQNKSTEQNSIVLKSGQQKLNLNSSEVSLGRGENDKLDLAVHKGSVQGLDPRLTQGKIKVLEPLPSRPIYVTSSKSEPVVFKWQSLEKGYEVQLQWGPERDKLESITNAVAAGEIGQMAAALPPGKSYFRLVAKPLSPENPELISSILRAHILVKTAPVLLAPAHLATLTLPPGQPEVKLLWSNPSGFEKMIVEVASSANLRNKVKTEYLDHTTEYTFLPPKEGVYYWRVSGTLEGRKEVVSSGVKKFKVGFINDIRPPVLSTPLQNEKIQLEAIKGHGLLMSWQIAPGASGYYVKLEKINISSERGLASTENVFESEGEFLQALVPDLKPGNYAWSVQSIDAQGQKSSPSEKRYFNIQTVRTLNWADGKTKDEFRYITLKPSISLKWERGDPKATHWIVRTTSGETTQTLESKTNVSGLELALPRDGLYQFEVEAFDDRNRLLARSLTREVQVGSEPLLPAPQFASSIPNAIETSGNGFVSLRWQQVRGATHYRLLLKHEDGRTAKEYSFKSQEGSLRGLMPGQYKVSLQSVDQYGRVSPESPERALIVPNQSNVQAPKLKGVQVK